MLENSFGYDLKVYPNPTDGLLNIDLSRSYAQSTVSVINSMGQEVDRRSFKTTQHLQLNMPEAAGLYLIEVHSGNQKAVFRVVKEYGFAQSSGMQRN